MKRLFVFCVFATAFFACSKDKFKTEPQVEIKSLSPDVVENDGIFTLRADVSDKEGDLKDTVKVVQKWFAVGSNIALVIDTTTYELKNFTFPESSTIEITLRFSYNEQRNDYILVGGVNQDREYSVGLIVQDEAGHKSEYKESKRILLKNI